MIDFFYDSSFLILKFFILGNLLGLIYDFFRLVRMGRNDKKYDPKAELRKRLFPQKKKLNDKKRSDSLYIFIEDIIFFLIVAVSQILMTFHENSGEIRIYCMIASFMGFWGYQKTIGNIIIFLSQKILYLSRRIFYWIIFLILFPIISAFRFFKKIIKHFKKQKKNKKRQDVFYF